MPEHPRHPGQPGPYSQYGQYGYGHPGQHGQPDQYGQYGYGHNPYGSNGYQAGHHGGAANVRQPPPAQWQQPPAHADHTASAGVHPDAAGEATKKKSRPRGTTRAMLGAIGDFFLELWTAVGKVGGLIASLVKD
ncbi:hypothetical protein GCM10027440_07960 [Nocardiopsis coralliicola]